MLGHNSLTIVRTIRAKWGRNISVVHMGRRRVYREGVSVPLTIKSTKFESAYTDIAKDSRARCALCVNFNSMQESATGMGACTKVLGIISPSGWCRYYDRKLRVVSE